jgi:hypothetical protein
MKFTLVPHPKTPSATALTLHAAVIQNAEQQLAVRFTLAGNRQGIILPPPAPPLRSDDLWQTTCFEMFLKPPDAEAYQEYNFSPSSAWAAYAFAGYRSGRSNLDLTSVPLIRVTEDRNVLTLEAQVALPTLRTGHRLGLSAVIDHGASGKSYWAIAHPPGPPDFHHRDCFAGQVGAAGGA